MKQLLQLCEEVIIKKFFFIPKFLDIKNFDESEDFILTKSPYHTSIFNICWVKKTNPIYFENSMRKVIEYFSPKPFSLWFGPNNPSNELEQTLNSLGFIKNTNKVAMVSSLFLFHNNYENNELIEIIEMKSEKELEQFLDLIEDSEPCARGYFKKVAHDLGFSSNKPYRYFYLCISGKPICLASLFFHNEICGLFDLFTHPEHRRKGYSLKLLQLLSEYAKENGAKHLCLIASAPLELNLNKLVQSYKNLGFIEQGEYQCYEYEGSGL